MFYIAIWPILLLVIHFIVDEVFEIDRFGEILIKLSSARRLTNSKYNNTVHAKSLTVTDHGLVMRVLLPLLQCAPETKRQNIFPEFRLNCTTAKIHQSQSYYKWFETRVNLLVKVGW